MGVKVSLRISPNIAGCPGRRDRPSICRGEGHRPPVSSRLLHSSPGGAALGVLDTLVIDYREHELHVRTLNTAGFP